MVDNVTVDNGTGTDYGVAGDKVTYSGDADQTVQLVRMVNVSGAEGSRNVDGMASDTLSSLNDTVTVNVESAPTGIFYCTASSLGAPFTVRVQRSYDGSTWVNTSAWNLTTHLRVSEHALANGDRIAIDALGARAVRLLMETYTSGSATIVTTARSVFGLEVDLLDPQYGYLAAVTAYEWGGQDARSNSSISEMLSQGTGSSGPLAAAGMVFNGTSWDRMRGSTNGLWAQGNVAHDAADSGNPIKIGGKASDGSHAAVAHGDRVDAWFAPGGQQVVTVAGFAVGGGASAVDGTDNGNTTGLLDPEWGSRMLQTSGMVFNGTSWDRQRGNTAGTFQQGNVAHDAADSGNPVKIGGKYVASMVAVADGDRTNILTDQYGRIRFSDGDSLSVAGASGDVVVSLESPSGTPIEATGVGASSALNVGGNVAHDAADSGNPVKIGAKVLDPGSLSAALGDRVDLAANASGILVTAPLDAGAVLGDSLSNGDVNVMNGISGTGEWQTGAVAVGPMVFNGTTWDRLRGNATGGLFAQGAIAHDAVDSGNPLKIGGYASTAAPTAVAAGDRVNAWYMTDGRAVVTIAGTGGVAGTTTPADAAANAIGANVWSENALFNGTTWDRLRNLPAYDTAVAAPVRLGIAAVAQPDQRFTSVALGTVVSNTQAWDCNGADDVLIHLGSSQTGTFTFEVTADGTNWSGATVRDTATNLWVSGTNLTPTANKVYRILTHGWRSVRARTVTTLNGTVAMTATLGPRSPLDQGTVTGAAPHDFGYTPWSFSADISTGTTTNIKTPTSGRRLVTTAFTLGTAGTTAGLVTVWYAASGDTTVSVGTDDILFRGALTPTANATPGVVMTYPNNPPTGTVDFLLKVTTGAATTLYVTARGYEVV